jgi:hypothetical protein
MDGFSAWMVDMIGWAKEKRWTDLVSISDLNKYFL